MNTNTAPTVFQFHTHEVRTIVKDGEPWFIASDVCKALEYRNTSDAVATHLDSDEKMTIASGDSHSGKRGGAQSMTIISESGLYALVLRSRKPEARKFAKWVTSEVLPAIRKTGEYRTPYVAGPNDVLSAAQAEQLRIALNEKCRALPKDKQGVFMKKGWSKLKSHFGCAYRQIPQHEFIEALSLVARHAAEWELVDGPTLPPVDVGGVLLNGQSSPTIRYPAELNKEIDLRAWEMAGEAFHLIREHLHRRVAYRCEFSYPKRVLDLPKAMRLVRDIDLGQALAHKYYDELESCIDSFARAKDQADKSMGLIAATMQPAQKWASAPP